MLVIYVAHFFIFPLMADQYLLLLICYREKYFLINLTFKFKLMWTVYLFLWICVMLTCYMKQDNEGIYKQLYLPLIFNKNNDGDKNNK